MIPLSPRLWAPTAVLLAATALPVWLHEASGATFDPCADPSALSELPALGPEHPRLAIKRANYEDYPLAIGGELAPPLHFWMIRTEVPFDFYGHPDSLVTGLPLPEDRRELHALAVGSDVLPVHRRYDDSLGVTRFSQYVLIQGTRPVRHPLLGGLAHAVQQLLRGTEPVTMFAVEAVVEGRDLPGVEAAADAWLAQAWSDFRRACLP